MTTDAGSGFDKLAAGRDTGDARLEDLEEETTHLGDEDLEEEQERKHSQDSVNDAF